MEFAALQGAELPLCSLPPSSTRTKRLLTCSSAQLLPPFEAGADRQTGPLGLIGAGAASATYLLGDTSSDRLGGSTTLLCGAVSSLSCGRLCPVCHGISGLLRFRIADKEGMNNVFISEMKSFSPRSAVG